MNLKIIIFNEKSQTTNKHVLYDSIYVKYQKIKTNLWLQETESCVWGQSGVQGEKGGGITKKHEETLVGGWYVHCLDCSDCGGTYMSKIIKLYSLGAVHCVSITLQLRFLLKTQNTEHYPKIQLRGGAIDVGGESGEET